MKIIFIRHGKTLQNEKGIINGCRPGRLSKLGIKQAKKNARLSAKVMVDCIYSSDLARALATAKILARSHKKAKFKIAKQLRESYLGKLEGTKIDPRAENSFDTDYCKGKFKGYGVETPSHFYGQFRHFLRGISKSRYSTIMLVSHSITFRFFVAALRNKPVSYTSKVRSLDNDEIAVFEIINGSKNKPFNARLLTRKSVLNKSIMLQHG